MKLDRNDLRWAERRLPRKIKEVLSQPEWGGRVYIAGGFIRSIVSNEQVNDIDLFVGTVEEAENLANVLSKRSDGNTSRVWRSDNAFTVRGIGLPVQIIHRWLFSTPESVADSFDFTVCCAAMFLNPATQDWDSFCDDRFYIDLAAKRLVYRHPKRNEDAGGSFLRLLKFYQRGYRAPLDSMAGIISRLLGGIKPDDHGDMRLHDEAWITRVVTSMLVEVDPMADPDHTAHLPSTKEEQF